MYISTLIIYLLESIGLNKINSFLVSFITVSVIDDLFKFLFKMQLVRIIFLQILRKHKSRKQRYTLPFPGAGG